MRVPPVTVQRDAQQAIRSCLDGREWLYDPNDAEGRKRALAEFEAHTTAQLAAIENRLGRALTLREMAGGIVHPEDMDRMTRAAQEFEFRKALAPPADDRSPARRALDAITRAAHAERVGPRRDALEQAVAKEEAEREEAERQAKIEGRHGHKEAMDHAAKRLLDAKFDPAIPASEHRAMVFRRDALKAGVLSPLEYEALDRDFVVRHKERLAAAIAPDIAAVRQREAELQALGKPFSVPVPNICE